MKLSEKWLREWVPVKFGSAELAERLTMAGLQVDAVTPVAAPLDQVVVGEVVHIEPHPQAERLRVCRVSLGKKKEVTIVCGAANVAVGMKAPVALVGATLPQEKRIAATEIRGVASAGMLCSAQELGLEEESSGLLELDADAKPGAPVARVLELDDHQIEIDLTPNRADCLSIAGLARELSALTGVALQAPRIGKARVRSRKRLSVSLKAKANCPQYCGRVIEGIDPTARTPLWMRERLRRAGVRSIHPVVDVTNYVMLELGQPMHAFDLNTLRGGIVVRAAQRGEALALLDGTNLKLPAGALVIADKRAPVALAGIMGGAESAVSEATTDLFLESAYFHPSTIGLRARALGLHTESSHRFERGVDPALQAKALERATALLLDIVGGRAGPVVSQTARAQLPKRPSVALRQTQLERLLGYQIRPTAVQTNLKRLGMKLVGTRGVWRATPPSWRFDIQRECDLIEEVARITGYAEVPVTRPRAALKMGSLPEGRVASERLRGILVDRDYQEAVTYSFVDAEVQQLMDPGHKPVALKNPISADLAVMRTSLWQSLLRAVVYNQNRQQQRIRLFEIGRRYLDAGAQTREEHVVAGVISGPVYAKQWGIAPRDCDFFDLKGDVEALLGIVGDPTAFRFERSTHPSLHPGQASEIWRHHGQKAGQVGMLGRIHPRIESQLGLEQPVYAFELLLESLNPVKIPEFCEISRYPAVRRDLALVLEEAIPAQRVIDSIRQSVGKLLVNLELFDVYRGEGIDSGRKSLALGLTFQDSSRTLREEEVESLMQKVVGALHSELGAILRQ